MSARKDYRVTVKVRNNNILLAAEAAGYKSIAKLAEKIGCSYHLLNHLINMTYSPVDQQGAVRPFVDALCVELKSSFGQLFSSEQTEALATNRSSAEMSAEEVFALTNSTRQIAVDDDIGDVVGSIIGTALTNREQSILRHRFGFDGPAMTYSELAEEYGVSLERIRQIEAKALRKLRHPSNSEILREYAGLDPLPKLIAQAFA